MSEVITEQQVKNCLYNGNYKEGKLCGGFHSAESIKAHSLTMPDNIPDNTSVFLYFNGNVILYVASGNAVYNTSANGKLSNVQLRALELIKNGIANKGMTLTDKELGWKSANGGSKGATLEERIANML